MFLSRQVSGWFFFFFGGRGVAPSEKGKKEYRLFGRVKIYLWIDLLTNLEKQSYTWREGAKEPLCVGLLRRWPKQPGPSQAQAGTCFSSRCASWVVFESSSAAFPGAADGSGVGSRAAVPIWNADICKLNSIYYATIGQDVLLK